MNRLVVYNVSLVAGVGAASTGAGLRFGYPVGLMVAGALMIALTLLLANRG